MIAQDQQKRLSEVVAKAWANPAFKARLKSDPKGVLADVGIITPEDLEIEVVENTERKQYLTLPATPLSDVVSDEELVRIASPNGLSPFAGSTADHCDSCRAGC